MSGFDINKVDNPQNTPQKPVTQEQGVTREQFIINIFGGADSAKMPGLANKADSIFNQLDNSPKDGTLSKTEADKGSQAIETLKKFISVAIGGAKNTQETSKDSPEVDYINSLPSEEQASAFVQKLDEMKTAGCKFIGFDGEIIEAIDKEGQKFTISPAEGLSEEAKANLDKVVTDYMADDFADAAGVNVKIEQQKINLNSVLDAYEQKGFYPEGTPVQNKDGDLIGTLRNDKGEEVKINLSTGKEITDE